MRDRRRGVLREIHRHCRERLWCCHPILALLLYQMMLLLLLHNLILFRRLLVVLEQLLLLLGAELRVPVVLMMYTAVLASFLRQVLERHLDR